MVDLKRPAGGERDRLLKVATNFRARAGESRCGDR
jgi:hypothetical protein